MTPEVSTTIYAMYVSMFTCTSCSHGITCPTSDKGVMSAIRCETDTNMYRLFNPMKGDILS